MFYLSKVYKLKIFLLVDVPIIFLTFIKFKITHKLHTNQIIPLDDVK